VKEDSYFICQNCGCKYTPEDAKKLLKEINIGAIAPASNEIQENYDSKANNIPFHSPASPNKISAKVIKVGHTTYTAASVISSLWADPEPVFVDGPDVVSNIGAAIQLKNLDGKTIKYANVHLAPFNAVGDKVECTVRHHSLACIEITGPLAKGQSWEGYAEDLWYNNSIAEAKIDHIRIVYMDDSEEIYDGNEFYKNDAIINKNHEQSAITDRENIAYLTVKRNQTSLLYTKHNRLECVLSNGERFEFGYNQTVTIPVKHGTYKIAFEMWGGKLIPAKNKSTQVFVVDGDMYIELTPDTTWGGFKTKIIK